MEQGKAKAACEKESEAGRYSEALDFFEAALKLAESIYEAEHRQVAPALHDMGIAFDAQGQYADVEARRIRGSSLEDAG